MEKRCSKDISGSSPLMEGKDVERQMTEALAESRIIEDAPRQVPTPLETTNEDSRIEIDEVDPTCTADIQPPQKPSMEGEDVEKEIAEALTESCIIEDAPRQVPTPQGTKNEDSRIKIDKVEADIQPPQNSGYLIDVDEIAVDALTDISLTGDAVEDNLANIEGIKTEDRNCPSIDRSSSTKNQAKNCDCLKKGKTRDGVCPLCRIVPDTASLNANASKQKETKVKEGSNPSKIPSTNVDGSLPPRVVETADDSRSSSTVGRQKDQQIQHAGRGIDRNVSALGKHCGDPSGFERSHIAQERLERAVGHHVEDRRRFEQSHKTLERRDWAVGHHVEDPRRFELSHIAPERRDWAVGHHVEDPRRFERSHRAPERRDGAVGYEQDPRFQRRDGGHGRRNMAFEYERVNRHRNANRDRYPVHRNRAVEQQREDAKKKDDDYYELQFQMDDI